MATRFRAGVRKDGENVRYLCKCNHCGHGWWTRGEDEPDVNALTLEVTNCELCGEDDYEIVEQDWDDEDEWA